MSQRSIALEFHVSRNTVANVIAAYKSINISHERLKAIDDDEFYCRRSPDEMSNVSAQMPACDYVHKDLLNISVAKNVLERCK